MSHLKIVDEQGCELECPEMTRTALSSSQALEHFIPIRKAELIEHLCQQPGVSPVDQDGFRRLCQLLDSTLHFEYHAHLEDLKTAYASFDPDSETLGLANPDALQRMTQLETLFERFGWLLERANFRKLSKADVDKALDAASHHGLSLTVDFDFFDRLEIYSRGDSTGTQQRRHWKKLWRLETVEVPTFKRLVVIFKLRAGRRMTRQLDTDDVFIKLFKDIPTMDLEMLLPGTQVKMALLDRIKIAAPTVAGIAISLFKAVKGALLAAAAGIYGILAVVGVTAGYGVKSFFGYLRTKQKYQLNLTESLYYQNLDNNAGVLCRLLDEAEEQENREAVLAYFFLWRQGPGVAKSAEDLDQQIEHYLNGLLGRPMDFEVSDALAKLLRMGLARQVADGGYVAVPLGEALEALDHAWDNYFSYNAAA